MVSLVHIHSKLLPSQDQFSIDKISSDGLGDNLTLQVGEFSPINKFYNFIGWVVRHYSSTKSKHYFSSGYNHETSGLCKPFLSGIYKTMDNATQRTVFELGTLAYQHGLLMFKQKKGSHSLAPPTTKQYLISEIAYSSTSHAKNTSFSPWRILWPRHLPLSLLPLLTSFLLNPLPSHINIFARNVRQAYFQMDILATLFLRGMTRFSCDLRCNTNSLSLRPFYKATQSLYP